MMFRKCLSLSPAVVARERRANVTSTQLDSSALYRVRMLLYTFPVPINDDVEKPSCMKNGWKCRIRSAGCKNMGQVLLGSSMTTCDGKKESILEFGVACSGPSKAGLSDAMAYD